MPGIASKLRDGRLRLARRGVSTIEYVVLMGLVGVLALAVLGVSGQRVTALFDNVNESLQPGSSGTGPLQVTGLSTNAVTGAVSVGTRFEITVTFNQQVTPDGATPAIPLQLGLYSGAASYQSGAGTSNLVFVYEVAEGIELTDYTVEPAQLHFDNQSSLRGSSGNVMSGANYLPAFSWSNVSVACVAPDQVYSWTTAGVYEFVVPCGISTIELEVIGGGGAGGNGGGGGGGGVAQNGSTIGDLGSTANGSRGIDGGITGSNPEAGISQILLEGGSYIVYAAGGWGGYHGRRAFGGEGGWISCGGGGSGIGGGSQGSSASGGSSFPISGGGFRVYGSAGGGGTAGQNGGATDTGACDGPGGAGGNAGAGGTGAAAMTGIHVTGGGGGDGGAGGPGGAGGTGSMQSGGGGGGGGGGTGGASGGWRFRYNYAVTPGQRLTVMVGEGGQPVAAWQGGAGGTGGSGPPGQDGSDGSVGTVGQDGAAAIRVPSVYVP